MVPRLKRLEAQALARRVVHFFENEGHENVALTCRHFMAEGINRRTISGIISRYKERGTADYKDISGRPRKISTPKAITSVSNLITKHPTKSVRNGAQQLGLAKSTYHRIKAHQLGIKAYHKTEAPKYIGDQEIRAKRACRKIYREKLLSSKTKILVMDDETYVPVDPDQVPGVEFYHASSKTAVDIKYRVKAKQKFTKKYLIWQCLDERGNVSDPFISKGTMNGYTYLNECLKKRLLPFVKKYHKLEDIVFWPDMATSHYKKEVVDWLKKEKISFIEKHENAPNVPQARPIEEFWALCKAEYKKRKEPAKNINSFARVWKNISTKIGTQSAQTLMKGARKKIRAIAYTGVRAVL